MAIADKLQTVASGVTDIRTALKEIDSNFGAGHISTLDDEIRQIGSNSAFVLYKDSQGNYKTMHVPISGNTLPDIRSSVPGDIITVLLPESITILAGGCFQNCTTLEYINTENITQFGQHRCLMNTGISSLRLGKRSGTKIQSVSCFQGCTKLKEVYYLNENHGIDPIGNYIFANDTALEKVYIASMRGWLLNTWGNNEASQPLNFAQHLYNLDGTEITEVVIPNDITSINAFAFTGGSNITSVTIPSSVTSIGTSAFKNCSNLINFTNLSTALISTQTNDAWSCGNGTGIFETYGDVKRIGSQNINFKQIIIHGNLDNNSGYYLSRSSTLEIIKIGGNLTASTSKGAVNALLNTYGPESNLKFIEVGGTITGYPIQNGSGSSYIGSNCIFHLKYNGIACTPSQIELDRGGTRVSKVYVDSQSVLNQYLANSDWATYSSKLDLWSNYTGTYKS